MRRFACLAALAVPFAFAAPALAAEYTVTISGFSYEPAELTVAAGDTVTFINEDSVPHSATASDGSFDTGRLAKGESATVTIETAGEIAFLCSLHPAMKATITAE